MEAEDDTDYSIRATPGLSYKSKKDTKCELKSQKQSNGGSNGCIKPTATTSVLDAAKQTETNVNVLEYNFTHPKRGVCVVFNNMHFEPETQQKPRKGSEKDKKNVMDTFMQLGFTIKAYDDSTCLEMWSILDAESKADHSEEDCFVCVILSHGDRTVFQDFDKNIEADVIYGTDQYMFLKDLTGTIFNEKCSTLNGKPKIFITQACRGNGLSEAVEYKETVTGYGETWTEPVIDEGSPIVQKLQGSVANFNLNVPIDVDCILVCSSPPGFYSFRSPMKGSFFIKALCDQLNALHNSKDLLTILTRVNYRVAYEYESTMPSSPAFHRRKQMPWIASLLTKDVYLKTKEET